jgi:hypothetical protein
MKTRTRARCVGGIAAIAILLIAVSVGADCWYGSLGEIRTFAAGRRLYVLRTDFDCGALAPHETKTVEISVKNISHRSVAITGSHTTCECLVATTLPVTVQPRETKTLPIAFRAPASGHVEAVATLFTCRVDEQIPIRLTGRVTESEKHSVSSPAPLEPRPNPSFASGSDAAREQER